MISYFVLLFNYYFFFFFQVEDGIRDLYLTGVQTCALPISSSTIGTVVLTIVLLGTFSKHTASYADLRLLMIVLAAFVAFAYVPWMASFTETVEDIHQIGRASCRDRMLNSMGSVSVNKL